MQNGLRRGRLLLRLPDRCRVTQRTVDQLAHLFQVSSGVLLEGEFILKSSLLELRNISWAACSALHLREHGGGLETAFKQLPRLLKIRDHVKVLKVDTFNGGERIFRNGVATSNFGNELINLPPSWIERQHVAGDGSPEGH